MSINVYSIQLFHLLYDNSTSSYFFFFFFNDTATTEIYTLSLHDALPISFLSAVRDPRFARMCRRRPATDVLRLRSRSSDRRRKHPDSRFGRYAAEATWLPGDRKSTRLNSSHTVISYAVFCLKKKKNKQQTKFSSDVQCRLLVTIEAKRCLPGRDSAEYGQGTV